MKHLDCNLQPKEEKNGQYYVAFNYCTDHEVEVCVCGWEYGKHFGESVEKIQRKITKPVPLSDDKRAKIIQLREKGLTFDRIAEEVERSYSTVRGVITRHKREQYYRNKVLQGKL